MASIIDRIMRAGEGKILRDLSKIVDKVNALNGAKSATVTMGGVESGGAPVFGSGA